MTSTKPELRAAGSGPVLDDAERASRDEIIALQTKRMAWTLAHAYGNVAHYKKAFDARGVHPSDFRQLSDLAKFPFTLKTDLRDNYPFNMFAVPREKLVRVHASSGTTGKPIVVGYTQADIITVTPSYMLAILDEFKRQKLDSRKSSLKFGIFGAEPWTNAMRVEIAQAFDMDATDIYGLSEVIGPGVAQECVE